MYRIATADGLGRKLDEFDPAVALVLGDLRRDP
jgi:hypothetical protein